MNNIYTHDFCSLKSESLRINDISQDLVFLTPDQIYKSASYFKILGFNSYQKDRNSSKSKQEIRFDSRNLHEVVFILKINCQEGIHIEFSGASANRIFNFIKQEHLQWQKLLQHKAVLHCTDAMIGHTNQLIKLAIPDLSMSPSSSFRSHTLTRTLVFLKTKKVWLLNLVIDKVIGIIMFTPRKVY